MWMLALRLLALLTVLPLVNAALLAWPTAATLILLAVGFHFHRSRRDHWAETRLIYDEAPDPAIHSLNLLR